MNTRPHTFLTLLGINLLAAVVWSGLATAGADGKLYPATMCVDQYGPTSTQSRVAYSELGGVYNKSTNNRYVTVSCPIVKDVINSKGGIKEVTVNYTDRHPTARLRCSVEMRDSNPETEVLQGVRANSPRGIKTGSMKLRGPSVGTKVVRGDSHYIMTCTLPPRPRGRGLSVLHSYAVTEYGD